MTSSCDTFNPSPVDAHTLKAWLSEGVEIAVLDVREHGQYGEAHLFFGVTVPYSRLECDMGRLVPRRSVRIVVYDEGDDVARRAAVALVAMGYTDVHVLQGGVQAWREAGYALFAGVNVPSKTFGELAEHEFETPRISARDLAARLADREDLVVLDGRPFTEYGKMNIPGATCCPNGELALRVQALVPDPDTTIVINCAGRTRSIIGAQTLINFGIPNPVLALENGTQGWYLEDLQLEHGSDRRHGFDVDRDALSVLRAKAAALAERADVQTIDAVMAAQWLAQDDRTTYLCDVRTPEEFAQGSLPGAVHTPGGQLIQATDQYVAVQGARLVLLDDDGVRAAVVASWLVQMGWEAVVLDGGVRASLPVTARWQPAGIAAPQTLDVATFAALCRQADVQLVDVRSSMSFRQEHVAGAVWSIRPRLSALVLQPDAPVIVIGESLCVAALARQELVGLGMMDVRIHIGSPAQWRTAGLALQATPHQPADAACIDYLFFVHDRHDGNKQAARQYLAWETDLIHQIDAQERARFRFSLAVPTTTKTEGV